MAVYLIADATYIEEFHNVAITSGAGAFYDVEFNGSANFSLQDDLAVNGDLTITAGTLAAATHTIELSGDWTNDVGTGGFLAETSTVDLVGSSTQTVRGSTEFYNLEVSTATAQTVQFESGQTQSIAAGGSLTLTGASGQALTLAPLTAATDWLLDVDAAATQSISYVSATYSDASGGTDNQRQRRNQPGRSAHGYQYELVLRRDRRQSLRR